MVLMLSVLSGYLYLQNISLKKKLTEKPEIITTVQYIPLKPVSLTLAGTPQIQAVPIRVMTDSVTTLVMQANPAIIRDSLTAETDSTIRDSLIVDFLTYDDIMMMQPWEADSILEDSTEVDIAFWILPQPYFEINITGRRMIIVREETKIKPYNWIIFGGALVGRESVQVQGGLYYRTVGGIIGYNSRGGLMAGIGVKKEF